MCWPLDHLHRPNIRLIWLGPLVNDIKHNFGENLIIPKTNLIENGLMKWIEHRKNVKQCLFWSKNTAVKLFITFGWPPYIAPWFRLRQPSCGPGSNPKHTIYTFFNLFYWNCNEKITKINKKRIGPFFKKNKKILLTLLLNHIQWFWLAIDFLNQSKQNRCYSYCLLRRVTASVPILGYLLDFGQLFKAFGNN